MEGNNVKKWKCDACGYVYEGETPPEVCPVCGAGAEVFVETDGSLDEGMKQWICLFCGFIYETAEAPTVCPECSAKGANIFVEYDPAKKQMEETGRMFRCNACGLVEYADEQPEECPACGAHTFISREKWFEQRNAK